MPDAADLMEVIEPYRRGLLAHCYRLLGSMHDAEDVVQDTYVRAWRGYDRFDGRSSVRTWLYQIATNRCLSELSRTSRRVLPSGISSAESNPDAALVVASGVRWMQPAPDGLLVDDLLDPADAAVARAGLRLALVAAFQHLPPRQRAVLLLRDTLAFSAADVATILDMTVPSVKSALQRARARLSELAPDVYAIAEPTEPRARELLDAYIAAFESADATALERLLVQDVTIEATPVRNWFAGRTTCLPFLRDHLLGVPGRWRMRATSANGQPAAVAWLRDDVGQYQPYGVCVLTVSAAGIERISSFGDPGLVERFGFPLDEPAPGGTQR